MSDEILPLTAVERALERLVTIYGAPRSDNKPAFFGEFKRALSRFGDDVIEAGIDAVIDTHPLRSWPKPSECVAACRKAEPAVVRAARAAAPPPKLEPELPRPSAESVERCNALVRELKSSITERSADAMGIKRKPIATDRDTWNQRQQEAEERATEMRSRAYEDGAPPQGKDWEGER